MSEEDELEYLRQENSKFWKMAEADEKEIKRLKRIIHRLANALDIEGGNDELVEAARREAGKDE